MKVKQEQVKVEVKIKINKPKINKPKMDQYFKIQMQVALKKLNGGPTYKKILKFRCFNNS